MSEKRKREITDKIAEFVALDMRPMNIVEGEGFKELMPTEPGFTISKREMLCIWWMRNTRPCRQR